MDEKLVAITKDYLAKTEEAKRFLYQGLGVNTVEELMSFRSRMPLGTFYLNGMKHNFAFHGIGCRFSNEYLPNVPIDERKEKCLNIDMEMSGINPLMLSYFIEDYYLDFKKQFNPEAIKQEFNLGINEEIMYKEYDLYYFK